MGEDLPIGAIRNMMNPNAFGDPGRMSDAEFVCEDPGPDAGGVHSNSGVPNHAFALMADGGSYNGRVITGIGLTKACRLRAALELGTRLAEEPLSRQRSIRCSRDVHAAR